MKSIALGVVILFAALAPPIIGQEKETLHYSAGTGRTNLSFAADSIERQDPPTPSLTPYASVFRFKGNVVIRTCCIQNGTAKNRPKQVIIFHADEAEFNQETRELEVHGNVRVKFQNYPK
jgi:hypothetical protein